MKSLKDIIGEYTIDEMICPKCKEGTMKEFVEYSRCRNLDCRVPSRKYFQIKDK